MDKSKNSENRTNAAGRVSTTDETALKALKNGDEKAYTLIYNEYIHQLHSYAAKSAGSMTTAEDIVQDIFAKLWEERKTIKITESLQAYLRACVRNKWRNYIDHNKVERNHQENFWNENKDLLDSNTPETMLIAKDMESKINDVIDALPEQCRRVYLMWWKECLKYDEIAERLGISTTVVGVQINRAKIKLRKSLGYIKKGKKNS